MSQYRFEMFLLFVLATAMAISGCSTAAPAPPTLSPAVPTVVTTPIANNTPAPNAVQGAPVVLRGKTLFYVRTRAGSVSPAERAGLISKRLAAIANDPFRENLDVRLVDSDQGTDVLIDDTLVLTVSDTDSVAYGVDRQELAQRVADELERELAAAHQEASIEHQARSWGFTFLLLAMLALLLWLVNRFYHRLERVINETFARKFEKQDSGESLRYASQPLRLAALFLLRVARIALWLLLLIVLLPIVLSFFPETRALYEQIVDLLREPLIAVWEGIVQFLPNLFFILVIVFGAWLIIHGLRTFFDQVQKGTIRLGGFDPEWSPLTKNLLTLLSIALTLVIIFPYLPFSDAPAFQGISIFLGLLFTLSSSSVVANLIAGVMLTYNGAFRMGDLVELGGTVGTVVKKSLFTTRVRTFKNEEVSIPNSVVIGASIRNFSVLAKNSGLILHAEVTIGYDVPWRQVHELMIAAAQATPGIMAEPPPFVLQRSLNDWHVSYEINAYTQQADKMPRVLSDLMTNIQDKFNAAGVEIMSPSYYSLRDGNTVTIPVAQRAADYQAPSFRIAVPPTDNGAQPQ